MAGYQSSLIEFAAADASVLASGWRGGMVVPMPPFGVVEAVLEAVGRTQG